MNIAPLSLHTGPTKSLQGYVFTSVSASVPQRELAISPNVVGSLILGMIRLACSDFALQFAGTLALLHRPSTLVYDGSTRVFVSFLSENKNGRRPLRAPASFESPRRTVPRRFLTLAKNLPASKFISARADARNIAAQISAEVANATGTTAGSPTCPVTPVAPVAPAPTTRTAPKTSPHN